MSKESVQAQLMLSDTKIIQTKQGRVYVWSIVNYTELLSDGINKRDVEKGSIIKKLKELGLSNSLSYKDSGQPFFAGNTNLYISISHARACMAIYIADKKVGIDIEYERPKLFDGRNYFVNDEEEKLNLSQKTLQLIWGGKEAMFKQFGGKIDDLKNDVTLTHIDELGKKIQLSYGGKHYEFGFENTDETWLVYSLS